MAKERVIVDFGTPEDAKKVEETVKTGYAETAVENVLNWMAAEGDLAETYAKLANDSKEAAQREVFGKLREESVANVAKLNELLKALEDLDRERVSRIEMLGVLLA